MILHLTQSMATLALRLKTITGCQQVASWRELELVIMPGEWNRWGHHCGPNGSPWFLYGCWPGKHVGVDIANRRPDFEPMTFPAFKLDEEARVVFHLDQRLHALHPGRYTGIIRVAPPRDYVFDLPALFVDKGMPDKKIPPQYWKGFNECLTVDGEAPCDIHKPKHVHGCILMQFDIDLGVACADHYIDQAAVEFQQGGYEYEA